MDHFPTWTKTKTYETVEKVILQVPRSRWEIWSDRWRLKRWNVSKTKSEQYVCTAVSINRARDTATDAEVL